MEVCAREPQFWFNFRLAEKVAGVFLSQLSSLVMQNDLVFRRQRWLLVCHLLTNCVSTSPSSFNLVILVYCVLLHPRPHADSLGPDLFIVNCD